MKYIRIFICIIMVFIVTTNIASVYGSFLDDTLGTGNSFFSPSGSQTENSDQLGTKISKYFTDNFVPMIESIGNLVFFVVAAFLGVKYIWSGVDGKSQIKETLPTFVVGACMFFLAQTIYNLATGTFKDLIKGNDFSSMQNSIWGTASTVVNVLALAGIVALGLKYMISSADTKADIKKDLIPVVIGLVFVYATTNILGFIVTSAGQIIK